MLINFQKHFDNTYEEVFNKTLVAKTIMNTRFESKLTYGQSVERFVYDVSGVKVRDTIRGSASVIDAITDSTELLTINLEKESVFHLSDGEVTQAGPLNPGSVIGGQIGVKISTDLDARCFKEILNAGFSFDTGDLTTRDSNGTPITLSSTTVPQMTSRMAAKLRHRNNINTAGNMAFVVDAYAASDIAQYLMSKNIDLAGYVFQNGFSGAIDGANLYISENLTGSAVLGLATKPTANDTVSVGGLTYKFVSSPSAVGDVAIGANVTDSQNNLAAAINQGAGAGSVYVAWTGANLETWKGGKFSAVADNTAKTVTVNSAGAGRGFVVATSLTNQTDKFGPVYVNAYFGKMGAIDLVVQDLKKVKIIETADRRGVNIFSSYLAGIKTFADGAKKFLNVKIAA